MHIGFIEYVMLKSLPELLSNIMKQYPNIHLQVRRDIGIHIILLFEMIELEPPLQTFKRLFKLEWDFTIKF